MTRWAIQVRGTVQGVGFRPFVYRTARSLELTGWVRNSGSVTVEAQGPEARLRSFIEALRHDAPAAARIEAVDWTLVADRREDAFVIAPSTGSEPPAASLVADTATCTACLSEVHDAASRRHRYAFTTCAECGPRYTVVESLPYDRERTSMRRFSLCAQCRREYNDPTDRRFHAESIACPACGPSLSLLDRDGEAIARGDASVAHCVRLIADGAIVAMLGLGGFQLLADATNDAAVRELRHRKARTDKPFAVLFPTQAALEASCSASREQIAVLTAPSAPIVLLPKRPGAPLSEAVAPSNRDLGVMLPYTPLHALVSEATDRPLVCTSGNLSDEPICCDPAEARDRLGAIADAFLVHDRPVVRPVDDSVVRAGAGGVHVLRRARGFAPAPVARLDTPETVLALGAHLKSTVSLAVAGEVVMSQHIGDLGDLRTTKQLEQTARDLLAFFEAQPSLIACDLHPDYASTRLAEQLARDFGARLVRVQHHHAHVAACLAEHALDGPVLGFAWDGMGLGTDGTLWGGEALRVDGLRAERVATIEPFRLPGGDRAAREPRRAAAGALYAATGAAGLESLSTVFSPAELAAVTQMLARGVQAPVTTSMGRLFDAVAALAGLRATCSFEAQAAIELEHLARDVLPDVPYPFPITARGRLRVGNWHPMVRQIVEDRARSVEPGVISARFHDTLARFVVEIAERAALPRVALTGGCFQNAHLLSATRQALEARGFDVYAPSLVPPNDGGISLGQIAVAAAMGQHEPSCSSTADRQVKEK